MISVPSHFMRQFAVFLTALALVVASLIYFRETWDGFSLSYAATVAWQMAIWLPWAGAPVLLDRITHSIDRASPFRWRVIAAMAAIAFLAAHIMWFIGISDTFSPLGGFPKVAYGVYPYFFLFFTIIDVVILWGISVRIGLVETLKPVAPAPAGEPIAVKQGGKTSLLNPGEINWIAAEDYYAKIYSSRGAFLVRLPLKVLADRLPSEDFVQIHRSTLVRLDFIESVGLTSVTLRDGIARPVSRAGRRRLTERIH